MKKTNIAPKFIDPPSDTKSYIASIPSVGGSTILATLSYFTSKILDSRIIVKFVYEFGGIRILKSKYIK
jgi:hypothetical protein